MYETFEDAIAQAIGNVKIKLLKNITIKEPLIIPAEANIILDLNNYEIKADENMNYSGGMITIVHGASLTIEGNGCIYANVPNIYAPLQLTHKDYKNDTLKASLIINNGTFKGHNYVICGNGNKGRGNSEVIINGGTFISHSKTGSVIFNPQENSSIIINNGHLIGNGSGIEVRSGNLIVNNGIIETLAFPASVKPNGNGTTAIGSAIAICQHTTKNPINVEINNGTFKGFHAFYQANPQKNDTDAIALINLKINNGKFIATHDSILPIYSENKEHFIKAGQFSHSIDKKYML